MADTFDPAAYLKAKGSEGSLAPSGDVPVDPIQLAAFDPNEYLNNKTISTASDLQSKFGSTPQQVLAGIEGAARGATLGGSDYLETRTGASTPEAIQGRMQANPITSSLGNMAGGAALMAGTGGFGGLAEGIGTAVGGTTGKILGHAAEGALFGGGNIVTDAALGDPNLNAQKVISDLGMGALIGGGIGGLGALSKSIGAVPALYRKLRGAGVDTPVSVDGLPRDVGAVIDVPTEVGKKPTSLEEMQKRVKEAKEYGGQHDILELPQKSEAQEADGRLSQSQQFPISEMQLNSLNSQDARNEFKTLVELPGENGEILRNYQGAQKKELVSMLDRAIDKEIAPGYDPTTNAVEAGERAAQSFTDAIESNRAELRPAFKTIKKTPLSKINHLNGVTDYLTNPDQSEYANPKIANMFDTTGDSIAVKPYSTSMGIDNATYRAIKQAMAALEEKPENFENLFDIRKGLSQHVDVSKLGDAPREVSAAKAAMMDYIQDSVQQIHPDQKVRETFARWAQNEQNAQMIERKFGAEIGSNNWRSLAKGGDESILKKVFRDSESTAAAKAILPEEDFNRMLADHISILRNDHTKDGVFSTNNFSTSLRKSQYALDTAFANNAPTYQRIKDALTLARIFPDSAPKNPSGTTATLFQALAEGGLDPFKHVGNLIKYGKGKVEEALQAREINAKLAGRSDSARKMDALKGVINKITDQIDSTAKSMLKNTAATSAIRGAVLSGAAQLSDKEYDKIEKSLRGYYANPQSLLDNMADNSHDLYHAAPNVTQAIHTHMAQGVAFLNSKLPQAPNQMPLAPKWQPSIAQKSKFNQYYQAVQNPVSAIKQVKNGIVSNETMEALQTVYPALLGEMRQKVMEHMDVNKIRSLPYNHRLGLSKFLGQPLDGNMTPMAIASNQATFSAPSLSKQNAVQTGMRNKSTLGGLKELDFAKRASIRQQDEE